MKMPLALIIEDDEELAIVFAESLKAARYETEIFRDGGQALTRLAEIAPFLVVLDLHLPTVVGTEILKYIRADARLRKTHVIIATADARMADELTTNADFVLLKPIRYGQLRDIAFRLRGTAPLSGDMI